MQNYLNLMAELLRQGHTKSDRTGTGTLSVFGRQLRYDLNEGFPLCTVKYTSLVTILRELIWFVQGDTNVQNLRNEGCNIWNEWEKADGTIGPAYGYQWRTWPKPDGSYVDQLQKVIDTLKANPDSRRILVSAWNVGQLDDMALEPCHFAFQFYSRFVPADSLDMVKFEAQYKRKQDQHALLEHMSKEGGLRALSCQVYQRSADTFLGKPYNVASYAALTEMIACVTGHVVEDLVWTGGDVHLYSNHVEQAEEMLQRKPYKSPILKLNPRDNINDFVVTDFELQGYAHHPRIIAEVAV